MTKLIKDKINTIINTISSKKEIAQKTELSNDDRIVHSKGVRSDEYGHFNRMENL